MNKSKARKDKQFRRNKQLKEMKRRQKLNKSQHLRKKKRLYGDNIKKNLANIAKEEDFMNKYSSKSRI